MASSAALNYTIAFDSRLAGLNRARDEFGRFKQLVSTVLTIDIGQRMIAGVQSLAGAFRQAVADGVRFNVTLDEARIGIAAIYKQFNPGRYQDFAAAMRDASVAVEALKAKAVEAPGSFEDLAAAYKGLAGPMTAGGIAMRDQVDLVVLMSQSLAALGIRNEQLLQESRALVTGMINENAMAAKILGIRKQEIDAAKEQGRLYEFLRSRLSAFAEAGQVASKKFSVALSALKDRFQQVMGDAMLRLTDTLTAKFKELEAVIAGPEFQAAMSNLGKVIADAAGSLMNFSMALARNADTIAAIAKGLALVVAARAGLAVLRTVVGGLAGAWALVARAATGAAAAQAAAAASGQMVEVSGVLRMEAALRAATRGGILSGLSKVNWGAALSRAGLAIALAYVFWKAWKSATDRFTTFLMKRNLREMNASSQESIGDMTNASTMVRTRLTAAFGEGETAESRRSGIVADLQAKIDQQREFAAESGRSESFRQSAEIAIAAMTRMQQAVAGMSDADILGHREKVEARQAQEAAEAEQARRAANLSNMGDVRADVERFTSEQNWRTELEQMRTTMPGLADVRLAQTRASLAEEQDLYGAMATGENSPEQVAAQLERVVALRRREAELVQIVAEWTKRGEDRASFMTRYQLELRVLEAKAAGNAEALAAAQRELAVRQKTEELLDSLAATPELRAREEANARAMAEKIVDAETRAAAVDEASADTPARGAPMARFDRLARIGGFIGGAASDVGVSMARKTATGVETLVKLTKTLVDLNQGNGGFDVAVVGA